MPDGQPINSFTVWQLGKVQPLACVNGIAKYDTNGVILGWNQQLGCPVVWLSCFRPITHRIHPSSVGRRRKHLYFSTTAQTLAYLTTL